MFRAIEEAKKPIHYDKGRIYLTRRMERKFFFVLTLVMMGIGILYKLGIL